MDPRAPRFAQGIVALLLVVGIAGQAPVFVYLVAVLLSIAVITRWAFDPLAAIWRRLIADRVRNPPHRESPAPHRFAKLIGAMFTAAGSVAIIAGFALIGYALAGIVAVLAGLAATTGFCLGCRLYREVRFLQRTGIV